MISVHRAYSAKLQRIMAAVNVLFNNCRHTVTEALNIWSARGRCVCTFCHWTFTAYQFRKQLLLFSCQRKNWGTYCWLFKVMVLYRIMTLHSLWNPFLFFLFKVGVMGHPSNCWVMETLAVTASLLVYVDSKDEDNLFRQLSVTVSTYREGGFNVVMDRVSMRTNVYWPSNWNVLELN